MNASQQPTAESVARAAEGLQLLEDAILATLSAHPSGLYNSELARILGLESSHGGRHDNYLTYSVLGGLMERKLVVCEKRARKIYYRVATV